MENQGGRKEVENVDIFKEVNVWKNFELEFVPM